MKSAPGWFHYTDSVVYLFLAYGTVVAHRRIVGWLVNGGLERMWIRLGSGHLHEDAEGNRERASGWPVSRPEFDPGTNQT
jgi:hypothetical protein